MHGSPAESPRLRPLEPGQFLVGDADRVDVLAADDDRLVCEAPPERLFLLRAEGPPGSLLALGPFLEETWPEARCREEREDDRRDGRRSGPYPGLVLSLRPLVAGRMRILHHDRIVQHDSIINHPAVSCDRAGGEVEAS